MSSQEEPELDLKKYKRHGKTMPGSLILKILIALLVITGLYYGNQMLNKSGENEVEQEIELDFTQ